MIIREMTEGEERTYKAIIRFIDENGYPPTCRELCEETGLKSTSCIHKYLIRLTNKGMIVATGQPRAIKVIGYRFVKES